MKNLLYCKRCEKDSEISDLELSALGTHECFTDKSGQIRNIVANRCPECEPTTIDVGIIEIRERVKAGGCPGLILWGNPISEQWKGA